MTAYSDGPFVLYKMPYANEHSCRLESPDGYDSIRRQNNWRQHEGKRIDALWGITGDSAELQAMRYPKDQWQTGDARQHCADHNGRQFEPASAPEIRSRMTHIVKFVRPTALKLLDEKAGLISAVVSTEDVDRDGDIVRQGGWDLAHFSAHPILLSSHNYRGLTNQIGEWTQMKVEGTELVGEAKYYIRDGNEEADWGFKLAKRGRAAFSVGFVPDMSKAKQIEANGNISYEFGGQELLEVSQVTVPSNPQALQAMKGMNLHPEVEVLVEEMLGDMARGLVEFQLPPESPEPIDADAIALKVVALIREDIQKLVPSRETEAKTLADQYAKDQYEWWKSRTVSLPDAESIVREAMRKAIPDYREGR